MLSTVINQNMNVWQWKIILRDGFVDIPVVNTNSDLPILLGTVKTLANQVGYCVTSTSQDSICLVISFLIFKINSGLNFRAFGFTGLNPGLISNL